MRPISRRVTRSSTQPPEVEVKKKAAESTKSAKAAKPTPSSSRQQAKSQKESGPAVTTAAIDESDYKKMQDTHIQSLEREKKYFQNKKLREQNKAKEYDSSGDEQVLERQESIGLRKTDSRSNPQYNVDMGSMKLEAILRDYNNEPRQKRTKKVYLEKPFDLPYYKGIQLPYHLKWLTIYSRTNESVLMQEIEALELELMRLKESKVIHKEFR